MDGQSSTNSSSCLLSLKEIKKSFGTVTALANGTIDLHSGSIHALAGENGAGKSTLVKIMAGLYTYDSGEFLVNDKKVYFKSVSESKKHGISVIYQEPTLFPDLTISENIFVGRQLKNSFGVINYAEMESQTRKLFSTLGVSINPKSLAKGLSIADQQLIEIAKALSFDAKILIMDEPTAALSGVEVERLFTVVRKLRDRGAAIMFISHRFEEIFDLCDRITVMRDGRYISTNDISAVTPDLIVREMVGRSIEQLFPKQITEIQDVVLSVKNISRLGTFKNISFDVRAGEIVALAGLVGSGRTEVARAIFGIDPYEKGSVFLSDKRIPPNNPQLAIDLGIGFVPEDRRSQGLILELSVEKNISLTLRRLLTKFGFINPSLESQFAQKYSEQLEVKAGYQKLPASTLSGGNQQKVVLAKWLATHPKLLIIDEPTRGIDVGTKSEVHRLLSELAGKGMAILMISSELPEVLGMADRILVMNEGNITANLLRTEATSEKIMNAATQSIEKTI